MSGRGPRAKQQVTEPIGQEPADSFVGRPDPHFRANSDTCSFPATCHPLDSRPRRGPWTTSRPPSSGVPSPRPHGPTPVLLWNKAPGRLPPTHPQPVLCSRPGPPRGGVRGMGSTCLGNVLCAALCHRLPGALAPQQGEGT